MSKISFSEEEWEVFCRIISAIESGGQIYGNGDWGDFTEAYAATANETAITIGAYQFFGPEAHQVVALIQTKYPAIFKKYDNAGIAADLKASDWSYYQISKTSAKAKAIKNMISSAEGIICQKEVFRSNSQNLLEYAYSLGITDHKALAMGVNIAHLGGPAALKRIIQKTNKPYTVNSIDAALRTDNQNSTQVGAKLFRSRHDCVIKWLDQYWPKDNNSSSGDNKTNNNSGGNNMAKYAAGSIANSGHDENNSYAGGRAGDQTGTEWQIRSFYNRPWDCVLRYPNAQARATAARLGIDAANNNHIGYNQYQRTTFWTQLTKVGYEPSKITVNCDQDCSAGVSAIWKAVGYLMGIQALKNISQDNWTGSMKSAFRTAGFEVLTASKYLTSADYLLAGDVLLNESHHAALVVVSGSKSGETSSNSGSAVISDPTSGTLNNTVKSYLYTKKDNIKLRTWGGESASQLQSYPTVSKGTKLGYCDSIKVDGRDWYFVKISGSKGDKYGFVDSYDVSNSPNDVQNTETNVVVSGVAMTLSNGKTFNTSKAKWTGKVTANGDSLNFRTWAGADSDKLKSIPEIPDGKKVYVYDAILADDGSVWLYIKYKNIWGFVYSAYITKI